MPSNLHLPNRAPLIYLITSGLTTLETTPATEDFAQLLSLCKAAVAAEIDLIQLREKNLSAADLYAVTRRVAEITRGRHTKLLVNDRSDIAAAAGADGVHLASGSLSPDIVRNTFGAEFLIGVSTHSLTQARDARDRGADFVVFGPVFTTPGKEHYGEPQGLEQLAKVTSELEPFPVVALGGVTVDRVSECLEAGAQGIAAIRMLSDTSQLRRVVDEIRKGPE